MSPKPLPANPDPGITDFERIIDRGVLVPALVGASAVALGKAKYWHAVAQRYRSRLIQEFMERRGWDRETATRAADAVLRE